MMKKLVFLIALLITNLTLGQSLFVKSDNLSKSQYLDEEKNEINIIVNGDTIAGKYLKKELKNDYKNDYLLLNSGNFSYLITLELWTIKEIKKIKSKYDLNKIFKFFRKDKLEKKVEIVDTHGEIELISIGSLNRKIKERKRKKEKEELKVKREKEEKVKSEEESEKFLKNTKLNEYTGVYEIKVSRFDGTDYSDYEVRGKIFITENGVSFKINDLYNMEDLRVYYNKASSKKGDEGVFTCSIQGEDGIVVLIINEDKKTGAVTTSRYSNNTTTTFKIKNYIK